MVISGRLQSGKQMAVGWWEGNHRYSDRSDNETYAWKQIQWCHNTWRNTPPFFTMFTCVLRWHSWRRLRHQWRDQSCICRKGVRKKDYSRGPGDTRAVADLSAVTPSTIPAADRRTQSTGPRFAPVWQEPLHPERAGWKGKTDYKVVDLEHFYNLWWRWYWICDFLL